MRGTQHVTRSLAFGALVAAMVGSLVMAASGCSRSPGPPLTPAAQMLRDKGYRILETKGEVDSYTIGQDKLTTLPYIQYWAVQTVDPEPFLGKKATVEHFVVDRHPLDHFKTGVGRLQTRALGRTDVWVLVVEGAPVGGWSFPITNNPLTGGVYALGGENFEDVHPGVAFQDWRVAWVKRFSPPPSVPDPLPAGWSRAAFPPYDESGLTEPDDLSQPKTHWMHIVREDGELKIRGMGTSP